jgi:hypothetical protein
MKKIILFCLITFTSIAILSAQNQPEWVDDPMTYGMETYEGKTVKEESTWIYAVGESNLFSSESRARTKALQNMQETIAMSISTYLTKNTDRYSFSEYIEEEDVPQETLVRCEEALNVAFSIKVPPVETLKYYTEKENVDGKKTYKVYVLGRYLKKDLAAALEKMDVDSTVDSTLKKVEKSEGIEFPEELRVYVKTKIQEERTVYLSELMCE